MMSDSRRVTFAVAGILLVLALLIAPVAADRMVIEEGTDHDGNDYETLFPGSSMYNGTAPGCAEACLSEAVCNACTFKPRDQSCWLKQVVPPATARPGVTSYLKVRGEAQATQAPPAATTAPAVPAQPAPTTKKSPGFEVALAIIGCAGVLAARKYFH